MIGLELRAEFAEVAPGILVAHKLRSNVTDLARLADLLALLASEVELARVEKRGLDHARGQMPVVRFPGR